MGIFPIQSSAAERKKGGQNIYLYIALYKHSPPPLSFLPSFLPSFLTFAHDIFPSWEVGGCD